MNATPDSDLFFARIYADLRRLARARFAREAAGDTLQPTALVHEAYLRLQSQGNGVPWKDDAHFFGAAAQAMRRILIERARARNRRARRARREPITLGELVVTTGPSASPGDLAFLDLNDALERLENAEPRVARIVELHFFAGLELARIARILGVSTSTVKREWAFARTWLRDELDAGEKDSDAEDDSVAGEERAT